MKILSVTAQKPDSTGSGIYLTELVRGFKKKGITQSVIAGVTKADQVCLPEGVSFYPVYFESEQLPYPITGMSDEMPYPSTRYSDLTEEMTETFRNAFGEVLKKAVEELDPDVILCHHLYLLTAIVRELFLIKRYMECPMDPICGRSARQNRTGNTFYREFLRWMGFLHCMRSRKR